MKIKSLCQGLGTTSCRLLIGLTTAFACLPPTSAQTVAQTPLFLTSSAEPNVMFILDDSGSMHWEITPDEMGAGDQYIMYIYPRVTGNYGPNDFSNNVPSFRSEGTGTTATAIAERGNAAAFRSFHVNKAYYNPSVTYRPWVKPAGMEITAVPAVSTAAERFPNASPTAAPHSPIRNTGTRNLTVDNTETASWRYCAAFNPRSECYSTTESRTFFPATYFQFTGAIDTNILNRNNYQRVQIRPTTTLYVGHGRSSRSDCALAGADTCTYAEEIQNFANWYTYYRSRMLASQAGIGAAFVTQPEEMRVGFGSLNQASSSIDGVTTGTIKRGVRPFTGGSRNTFFLDLYQGSWWGGTPLRRALNDAGRYFSRTDNLGPWGEVPGVDSSTNQLTCRQSFSILMTDGYWTDDTDSQASTAAARANVDGTNGGTITGPALTLGGLSQAYTYNSATPFTDAHSNTLADVAMYYWNRDLRTDLENRVPSSELNPAFWQHMVTYGVALGVTGSINPSTAFGAINSTPPGTITWPNPTGSNSAKIDDLLHAAVNGRGGFFSASDPDTFARELSGVLSSIVARATTAGTAAAASSAVLQTNSLLYNASFRSDDWSGNIEARALNPTTGQPGTLTWNAESLLASRAWQVTGEPNPRNLVTRTEAGTPVQLALGNLGPLQQAALGINPPGAPATSATAENRVNWLRGREDTGLRSRTVEGVVRRIGDMIGSDPQYLSKRDYGYSLLPGTEGTSYRTFRNSTAYTSRPDALLVGSNNGFLHAFHARTGQELFAYMPSELLLPRAPASHAQINELMRPDYSHRYFVDGTAALGDAYVEGSWRTMLVGTMGAGGRSVFALDVTNPASFGAANVRWEFTHADLGFVVTKPRIVRLAGGRWAAVFGNGVNSATYRPRLFVVDLADGSLIHNLALGGEGFGSSADPNGLSPVETTDWPANDLSMSNAYAGDLHGNLWRVNFRTTTPTVTRLFSAVDSASPARRQPITSRPRVALKPSDSSNVVVTFGTGSFFKLGDDSVVSPQVQSLYGIFDSASPSSTVATRGNLRVQTITSNPADVTIADTTYAPGSLRFVTSNALAATNRGWVLNLPAAGERVISEPTFPTGSTQDRVRFTTLIPDDDPCRSGRNGFLMDISLVSGGRADSAVFDLSGDGVFNTSDNASGNPVSGIGGPTGETLTIIRDPNNNTDNLYSGDGKKFGSGRNTAGPVGRQSWRQLR